MCPASQALPVQTVIIIIPVSVTTVKITSIKTGVRKHLKIQGLQSRWWRFVDIDYFITFISTTSLQNLISPNITTESFKVKAGLHQGLALSPFLFAVIMDRLTDEVRREPPWTMLFADDIVICEEIRKEVEQRLECWRYALERRGMKVNGSKTEYLCINGGNDNKTMKMEGTKVPRIKEFNYLGSTVQESGSCEREVKK